MANYVLSEELRRAVVQVVNQHQSSFQPRPKRGRRVRSGGGGGGGETVASSTFAWVTTEGPVWTQRVGGGFDHGLVGRCRLTEWSGLIPQAPASGKTIAESEVEFANLHTVPIRVGSLVRLHCDMGILQGSRWPATGGSADGGTDPLRTVWAELVRAPEELYALPGAAPSKILWLPATSSKAADMRWDGGAC